MDGPHAQSTRHRHERVSRGPSIADIAREAGVGTATVDRVLNGRDSVREITRNKVLAAFAKLSSDSPRKPEPPLRRIGFLSDSGTSFNNRLADAVQDYCRNHSEVECPFEAVTTSQVDPIKLANLIERTAESVEALVIVAREDIIINRAIRNVIARRVPVACLTTDLPTSGRAAYIGSDQAGAGATAGYLMGQMVGTRSGKILLICSAPYRCQEERELGFRRILRSEFPKLDVDERVNSRDDSEFVYRNVVKYVEDHGAPVGIYNVAGGNLGIGRALTDLDLQGKVIFIGHELNANSRMLMETGIMHVAIGHDVDIEVAQAIEFLKAELDNRPIGARPYTRVRVYTKYNCY
jgi:LacI family transcriptional regulator